MGTDAGYCSVVLILCFLFFSSVVVRSKCPSYVGITGILVQEFKHVFKIITKEDKLKGETAGCISLTETYLPPVLNLEQHGLM